MHQRLQPSGVLLGLLRSRLLVFSARIRVIRSPLKRHPIGDGKFGDSMKTIILALTAAVTLAATAFGAQPPDVVSSDSNGNTAMGSYALLSVNSGYGNTAAGYAPLYSTTTGHYNTAFGYQALYSNTTGFNNIAIGPVALISNTAGFDSVAIGSATLS